MTESLEAYTDTLARFYSVWKPLENHLLSCPHPDTLDISNRLRADRLEADLRSLNTPPLPVLSPPFSSSDRPTLAGILYVLEGSRHGGKMISKVACERLPVTLQDGCQFFAQDPSSFSENWQSFVHWTHSLDEAEVVTAAAVSEQTFKFIQSAFV